MRIDIGIRMDIALYIIICIDGEFRHSMHDSAFAARMNSRTKMVVQSAVL